MAVDTENVWAVGAWADRTSGAVNAFAQQWDGEEWTLAELPVPDGATNTYLNSIDVVSDTDIWAMGTGIDAAGPHPWLLHWDGKEWSRTDGPDTSAAQLGIYAGTAGTGIHVGGIWAAGMAQDSGAVPAPVLFHHFGPLMNRTVPAGRSMCRPAPSVKCRRRCRPALSNGTAGFVSSRRSFSARQ